MSIPREYNKFCRLCFDDNVPLTSIFNDNAMLDEYINTIFSVEIEINDPYSNRICWPCVKFVIDVTKRRVIYRENNRRLKESSKKGVTEEEVCNGDNIFNNDDRHVESHSVVITSTEENSSKDNTVSSTNDDNIFNNVDPLYVEADSVVETNIHPSILKIFKKEKSLILPQNLLKCNFDAYVRVIKLLGNKTPKFRKRKRRESSISNDTDFVGRYVKTTCTEDVRHTRRKTKTVDRFGAPMLYEHLDHNELDIIMSDTHRHSQETNNRLNLTTNNIPVPNSDKPQNNVNTEKNNPDNNYSVTVSSSKNITNRDSLQNTNSHKNNRRFESSRLTNLKLIKCSEDKWNNFFNNYYEIVESEYGYESQDEEFEPLLSINEKRVYVCQLCEKVIYNINTYKQHLLKHKLKYST